MPKDYSPEEQQILDQAKREAYQKITMLRDLQKKIAYTEPSGGQADADQGVRKRQSGILARGEKGYAPTPDDARFLGTLTRTFVPGVGYVVVQKDDTPQASMKLDEKLVGRKAGVLAKPVAPADPYALGALDKGQMLMQQMQAMERARALGALDKGQEMAAPPPPGFLRRYY